MDPQLVYVGIPFSAIGSSCKQVRAYRWLHSKALPLNIRHTTSINDDVRDVALFVPATKAVD